jgi:tetratricopeptide (TPR) repeat protein
MDYYDLGSYSRPVTTTSDEAQRWFDRGLIWTYGYNHEEAISCFQKAVEADPGCAMAHWGVAYCIGPNYNKPWEAFEEEEKPEALALALNSLEKAHQHLEEVSPVERDLIIALTTRYPNDGPTDDYEPFNDAFADAMRAVHHRHKDDLDVCTLFAEAMMNRTPWQLWDLTSGQAAEGADTIEARAALEDAFQCAEAWSHPGLLHMYIHLMEMSPNPELALRHGDALAQLVPDSGHLLHMATHIDVLCGDYMNVVSRNHQAIQADTKYLREAGADNFYTVYRCHNYHFKIYGAMFLGQVTAALQTANELIDILPPSVLRPMADWFEAFVPMKQHALIRFGRWQDIVDQTLPEDPQLYSVTTAMMRYARTVALANLKRIDEAETECNRFRDAQEAVPESRMLFNNSCQDILKVAEQMMRGELAYHRGDFDCAFDHLRQSVKLDDELPYDEPWGWMQPTRHALGALLLEQQRFSEAEAVYRADLGLDATLSRACQHPENVWSLFGLHQCLVQRGELHESALIGLQLEKARARAEVPVKASCYCSKSAA